MNNTTESDSNGALAETTEVKDLRIPAALVRTALSSEQTLMSWVRTSLSLSTFGFSIAKFFQYLAGQTDAQLGTSARRLGLVLICLGVVVLIMAIVEHVLRIRALKKQGLPSDSGSYRPIGSAAVMLTIGLVALLSVFLRWQL
jgi:putative membrane protein